jgi:hypothetical protein
MGASQLVEPLDDFQDRRSFQIDRKHGAWKRNERKCKVAEFFKAG